MKKSIDELVDDYISLIQPNKLVTLLTEEEFKDWLNIDILEDTDMYR